jgi:GT2 family glycosyltransferase
VELSIVLPVGDDDGIARCLASITEDVEIVAVLNGATGRAERAVRADARVRLLSTPERNLGRACEIGVSAAAYDLVLIMNTDCTFEPGAIRWLRAAWRPATVVSGHLLLSGGTYANRLVNRLHQVQRTCPPHAFAPGLLLHRGIRAEIGGYFFHDRVRWTEDADFHRRCTAAGIEVVFCRGATIRHPPKTVGEFLTTAVKYGTGRAAAEQLGLPGTTPHFRLRPRPLIARARHVRRHSDRLTALFGLAWDVAFGYGVRSGRVRSGRVRSGHADEHLMEERS